MHKARVNKISSNLTKSKGLHHSKADKLAEKDSKSILPEYLQNIDILKVDNPTPTDG